MPSPYLSPWPTTHVPIPSRFLPLPTTPLGPTPTRSRAEPRLRRELLPTSRPSSRPPHPSSLAQTPQETAAALHLPWPSLLVRHHPPLLSAPTSPSLSTTAPTGADALARSPRRHGRPSSRRSRAPRASLFRPPRPLAVAPPFAPPAHLPLCRRRRPRLLPLPVAPSSAGAIIPAARARRRGLPPRTPVACHLPHVLQLAVAHPCPAVASPAPCSTPRIHGRAPVRRLPLLLARRRPRVPRAAYLQGRRPRVQRIETMLIMVYLPRYG